MDSTTAPDLPASSLPDHVKQELVGIVGTAHVLTSDGERGFYSEDVFRSLETAAAAVRPGTVEELAATVAAITKAGFAAVPRGGGMSYTDGYLHASEQSVTIDMRRLNRVVEINEQDMYVTVECGASWSDLNDALKAKGLRTPYWGPLSGLMATVGGALSQNSVFFGSGLYGTAVEQVLGMDVVLADGTIAPVGGHAIKDGLPFMKHYGPDLMGLFLADAGAHGFKARATLKLIKRPKHRKHMAAGFQSYEKLAAAISDLSRDGIAAEVMGFDAGQQSTRVTENKKGLSEDLKTLRKVIETGGIVDGIKVATAGRDYLKDVPYGLHFAIEDHFKGGLKDRISAAKEIITRHGGKTLPGSVTTIVHADPFVPPDSILGPKGERWVPVHCVVPHSRAPETIAAVNAIYEKYAAEKEKYSIRTGFLLVSVAQQGFLIEPVFFWPDARLAMYGEVMREEHLKTLPEHEDAPAARAVVTKMREELAEMFVEKGAVSFQIGKFYLYDRSRKPAAWELLKKMKTVLDPDHHMNPGALKL